MKAEITLDSQKTRSFWTFQKVKTSMETMQSINRNMMTSGAAQLNIYGNFLNKADVSPGIAVGHQSAVEKTSWLSDTSLVFKGVPGIPASFRLIGVTVASRISQIPVQFAFWRPNISASRLPFNVPSPSTGSTGILYLGFGVGSSENSQSVRIIMSDCVSSTWTSDSAIKSKTSQGIGFDFLVYVSASGFAATAASLHSFSVPTLSSFASRQLQLEVSAFGSGFGLNPSVTRRLESMKFGKRLDAHQNSVLITSDIFMQAAVVSSMTVEVEFLNATRLDDVQLVLKTQQREVVLLSSQCFGCTRSGDSLTLYFSDDGSNPAPTLLCHERTPYKPLLNPMKLLYATTGLLQLFVFAGSTPLSIATATIRAELRLLNVLVSQQLASSVSWTSDSSLEFSLPPGAGPNQTVGIQASGQYSNVLGGLSYPLPQIRPTKISDVATTGMALIEIFGRYFSYRSATVSVQLAHTSCSSSTWISDVSVTCRNAAGGGSLKGIVTSVELLHSETIFMSNTANGSLLPFAFVNSLLKSATPWMAKDSALFTGGMQIIVQGQNFGVIDVSFGMRIGVSSSHATLWISETSTMNRVGQRSNGLNSLFRLSANSLQSSTKLSPDHESLSFQILSVAPKNIARTGSSMLTLHGTHFALHSTTAALRIGNSNREMSFWFADSIISCKATASGFNLPSFIVFSAVHASPLIAFQYTPSLSESPLEVSSSMVLFPSEKVQDYGKTFLVSIFGENFGTSDSIQAVAFNGKVLGPSLWFSDSSLLCSVPILHFQSNRVEVRLTSSETAQVPHIIYILPSFSTTSFAYCMLTYMFARYLSQKCP